MSRQPSTMSDSAYRERLSLTLAHKPVDRCPIDLGGTPQSTVENADTMRRLAEYLGYHGHPPNDYDKFDHRILEHLDIDFRRAGGIVPFTTDRNARISDAEFIDCYGIRHRFSGMYWEIIEGPLRYAGIDQVAEYQLPTLGQTDIGLLDTWAEQARRLREDTPYVVVGEHPVYGILELACWLCGYDHIMMMLALDPEFIHLLFDKILDFQKVMIREYYVRMGRHIHLTTSGDDFGTQTGLFMSPDMWREFVKPYIKERIAYTLQFTDAVYMHHTCGAVFDIIPDLIEIGVSILNPIQPHAAGMDPVRLKAVYGDSITFHGGLDTQEVLPSDDMSLILSAVTDLVHTMDPQGTGGYIFAPAHNLQRDVSPRAIARMYEAAHRCF